MRTRAIFIVIIFALLLNIFHDFMITHQIELDKGCNYETTQKSIQVECYNQLDEMHNIFHFQAILYNSIIEFPKMLTPTPLFIAKNIPLAIYETSFKPPKA